MHPDIATFAKYDLVGINQVREKTPLASVLSLLLQVILIFGVVRGEGEPQTALNLLPSDPFEVVVVKLKFLSP